MARTKSEEIIDVTSGDIELNVTPKEKLVEIKTKINTRFFYATKWYEFEAGKTYKVEEGLKDFLKGCNALEVL